MAISYKKLWKLLIDKDMKKKDLQQLAGISAASVTKLGKNEYFCNHERFPGRKDSQNL